MLIEIGRAVPYQLLRRDPAGQPDYGIPLTLECKEEKPGLWSGRCRQTGDIVLAASVDQAQKELESALLARLAKLEKTSHLPWHLEQWGIVPINLRAAELGTAPPGKGSITAPPRTTP